MRIVVITLGYNPVEMQRASFKRFEETFGIPRSRFEHLIVDQHYPRDRAEIQKFYVEQSQNENVRILDPGKNLGLQGGFNYALEEARLSSNDIVIGFDPDCFPVENGWGWAMERVMADRSVAWSSLWGIHTERETKERGFNDYQIQGLNVRRTKTPVVNSVCCWQADFLRAAGGLKDGHKYYGGLECVMWPHLEAQKRSWVFLKDYREEAAPEELVDKLYREWKWVTTHGTEEQIEYGDWLRKRGVYVS